MQKNKKKTDLNRAAPMLILTALLVVIVLAAPTLVFAQQAQNAIQNATQNATRTTQGFGGPPSDPLTAVRYIFDDPTLRVWHSANPMTR